MMSTARNDSSGKKCQTICNSTHNDCVLRINGANSQQHHFHQTVLPSILEELEEIFIDLANTFAGSLEGYAILHLTKAKEQTRRYEEMQKLCRLNNPKTEIHRFISTTVVGGSGKDLLPRITPPHYSLTISPNIAAAYNHLSGLRKQLVVDRYTLVELEARRTSLLKEMNELNASVKQSNDVIEKLVILCQRNLVNNNSAKVYELQMNISKQQIEKQMLVFRMSVISPQLDLLNQKQSSAAGITLAPVTPAARRGGQSSIRTKWKEAFRNLTQSDKQSTTKEKSSKATTQREQELLEKYSRVFLDHSQRSTKRRISRFIPETIATAKAAVTQEEQKSESVDPIYSLLKNASSASSSSSLRQTRAPDSLQTSWTEAPFQSTEDTIFSGCCDKEMTEANERRSGEQPQQQQQQQRKTIAADVYATPEKRDSTVAEKRSTFKTQRSHSCSQLSPKQRRRNDDDDEASWTEGRQTTREETQVETESRLRLGDGSDIEGLTMGRRKWLTRRGYTSRSVDVTWQSGLWSPLEDQVLGEGTTGRGAREGFAGMSGLPSIPAGDSAGSSSFDSISSHRSQQTSIDATNKSTQQQQQLHFTQETKNTCSTGTDHTRTVVSPNRTMASQTSPRRSLASQIFPSTKVEVEDELSVTAVVESSEPLNSFDLPPTSQRKESLLLTKESLYCLLSDKSSSSSNDEDATDLRTAMSSLKYTLAHQPTLEADVRMSKMSSAAAAKNRRRGGEAREGGKGEVRDREGGVVGGEEGGWVWKMSRENDGYQRRSAFSQQKSCSYEVPPVVRSIPIVRRRICSEPIVSCRLERRLLPQIRRTDRRLSATQDQNHLPMTTSQDPDQLFTTGNEATKTRQLLQQLKATRHATTDDDPHSPNRRCKDPVAMAPKVNRSHVDRTDAALNSRHQQQLQQQQKHHRQPNRCFKEPPTEVDSLIESDRRRNFSQQKSLSYEVNQFFEFPLTTQNSFLEVTATKTSMRGGSKEKLRDYLEEDEIQDLLQALHPPHLTPPPPPPSSLVCRAAQRWSRHCRMQLHARDGRQQQVIVAPREGGGGSGGRRKGFAEQKSFSYEMPSDARRKSYGAVHIIADKTPLFSVTSTTTTMTKKKTASEIEGNDIIRDPASSLSSSPSPAVVVVASGVADSGSSLGMRQTDEAAVKRLSWSGTEDQPRTAQNRVPVQELQQKGHKVSAGEVRQSLVTSDLRCQAQQLQIESNLDPRTLTLQRPNTADPLSPTHRTRRKEPVAADATLLSNASTTARRQWSPKQQLESVLEKERAPSEDGGELVSDGVVTWRRRSSSPDPGGCRSQASKADWARGGESERGEGEVDGCRGSSIVGARNALWVSLQRSSSCEDISTTSSLHSEPRPTSSAQRTDSARRALPLKMDKKCCHAYLRQPGPSDSARFTDVNSTDAHPPEADGLRTYLAAAPPDTMIATDNEKMPTARKRSIESRRKLMMLHSMKAINHEDNLTSEADDDDTRHKRPNASADAALTSCSAFSQAEQQQQHLQLQQPPLGCSAIKSSPRHRSPSTSSSTATYFQYPSVGKQKTEIGGGVYHMVKPSAVGIGGGREGGGREEDGGEGGRKTGGGGVEGEAERLLMRHAPTETNRRRTSHYSEHPGMAFKRNQRDAKASGGGGGDGGGGGGGITCEMANVVTWHHSLPPPLNPPSSTRQLSPTRSKTIKTTVTGARDKSSASVSALATIAHPPALLPMVDASHQQIQASLGTEGVNISSTQSINITTPPGNVEGHQLRRRTPNIRLKSFSVDAPESPAASQLERASGARKSRSYGHPDLCKAVTTSVSSAVGLHSGTVVIASSDRAQQQMSSSAETSAAAAAGGRIQSISASPKTQKNQPRCESGEGGGAISSSVINNSIRGGGRGGKVRGDGRGEGGGGCNVVCRDYLESTRTDSLQPRVGSRVAVVDSGEYQWTKGIDEERLEHFNATGHVMKLSVQEKAMKILLNVELNEDVHPSTDSPVILQKNEVVVQLGKPERGLVRIRIANGSTVLCPLRYLSDT